MAVKEITTKMKQQLAFNVAAITSDTTTTGNIIDVSDADGGVNFTFFSGAYTDGSYVLLVEEGNDSGLSDAAAVDDLQLVAQDTSSATAPEAQTTIAAANKIKRIGYRGSKRYVRLSIVSTSTSSGATLGATVDLWTEIKAAGVVA